VKRPTLTQPFKDVQTLKKGGANLSYVPASAVVDRLNCALGVGRWSFTCEAWRDERDPDFVIAKGQFTVHATNHAGIGSCIIEQYGGQQINRGKKGADGEPGPILDLADDYKGSCSDALKKACSHIGVALYLSLGHAPMSAAKFDEERGGEPTGAEDDGDLSGTGAQEGNGSSSPAALTPGFSGDPL
jgi:hypothetical protein